MKTSLRRYWLLLVLLILFAALALYYSLALPLGEATDETHHFALVQYIAVEGHPPLTLADRQAIGPKGDASPLYHGLLALLIGPVDTSPPPVMLAAGGAPERYIPFDQRVSTQFLHTADELPPFDGVVQAWHLARLPSVLLGVMTLVLICLTALTILPGRYGLALAAAAFAAFLPRFVTSSAVVNDDNLVLPLIALAVFYLVRLAIGDWRWRNVWLLGATSGLAAIAKYHALVLLPEITLVFLWLVWRRGWAWRDFWRRYGAVLLAWILVAGWWFGWLLWQFNEVSDRGWLVGLLAPLGDPVTTGVAAGAGAVTGLNWPSWLSLLYRSFWIEYGGMQILAPAFVYWLLAGLIVPALIGLGLILVGRRDWSEVQRLGLSVLLLHLVLYGGVVLLRYLSLPLAETAQGRHLYPALSAIAILFAVGWRGLLPARWSASADYAVFGGLSALLLTVSLVTPRWFILPEIPVLAITTRSPTAQAVSHELAAELAPGVTLLGVTLPSTASGSAAVPVTLYWQAGEEQAQDALSQLCWQKGAGAAVSCHYRHPLDGRYPLRAWEAGFTILDAFALPLPGCLPAGSYNLVLTPWPLRRDQAATTFDEPLSPLSLGAVNLTPAEAGDVAVWLGDGSPAPAAATLGQLRQSLTVFARLSAKTELGPAPVQFLPDEGDGPAWLPVAISNAPCADPTFNAVTANFIVDAARPVGKYQLYVDNQPQSTLVKVRTAERSFSQPAQVGVPTNLSFSGEAELLGYNVDLSPRRPGEVIEVTAHWRAQNWMVRNYVTIIKLLGPDFDSWGQTEAPLGRQRPAVLRAPGEFFTDRHELVVSPDTPAGLYTIEFSLLYDIIADQFFFIPVQLSGAPEPVEHLYLGPIRVLDPAHDHQPEQALRAKLANQIELLGYDLVVDPRRSLSLALHWQAIEPPDADYTVFVQLLNPDGQVVVQQDNPPQTGRYPTTAWALRDRVVDRYRLALPADLPPGQYRLLAGMYDLATGQRLATTRGSTPLPDNAIELTSIILE